MPRLVWTVHHLVSYGHKGRMAAVQIVGGRAAKVLKNSCQLRQGHSSGVSRLPSVHDHKAVMARLVITDGASGVGLPNIILGVEGAQSFSVFIQQIGAEGPGLIGSILHYLLNIKLIGRVGFHLPVSVQDADI